MRNRSLCAAPPRKTGCRAHGCRLLALALLWFVPACSRKPVEVELRQGTEPMAWLPPVRDDVALDALFHDNLPEVLRLDSAKPGEALAACRRSGRVVVVPAPDRLPAPWLEAVREHLAAGGALLWLGLDPLAQPQVSTPAGWRTPAEVLAEEAAQAMELPGVPSVRAWSHRAEKVGRTGRVSAVAAEEVPWPAVWVDVERLEGADGLSLEGEGLFPPDLGGLLFHVAGGERTTLLTVTAQTEDARRWYAQVPLTRTWELKSLCADDFHPVELGGVVAPFRFDRVRALYLGMDPALVPQGPGPHRYGFSDLRGVRRPGWHPPRARDFPPISPAWRRYDMNVVTLQSKEDDARWTLPGTLRAQGPMPMPRELAGGAATSVRWIPLVEGLDARGRVVGAPVSLFLNAPAHVPLQRMGWIGLDPGAVPPRVLAELLNRSAARLQAGIFLDRAGASGGLFTAGADLRIEIGCVSTAPHAPPARVVLELLDESGRLLRRIAEAAPTHRVQLSLGKAPRPELAPQFFLLRIDLLDAGGQQRLDRLEQPIVVVPARSAAVAPPASVSASFLAVGRRPTLLQGLDYAPLFATDVPEEQLLRPGSFDVEQVRRDLDQVAAMGLNTLRLRYVDPAQAPCLRFLMTELARRRLWAIVSIPHLSPQDLDLARAAELLEAADLLHQAPLLALQIAESPQWGGELQRAAWDADWAAWLAEQYGEVAHAERLWGGPVARRAGTVCGPTDAQMEEAPPPPMVAAYRRFLADQTSRRCGFVRRWLRDRGNQVPLLGVYDIGAASPSGRAPSTPVDPSAGSLHLDLLGLRVRSAPGSTEADGLLAFAVAYARGMAAGRPVLLLDEGDSVGPAPTAPDLARQAAALRHLCAQALASGAAGVLGGRLAGGWHPDTWEDRGVVAPDGTWRPAAEDLRDFANQLRRTPLLPATWRGRTPAPDENGLGFAARARRWASLCGEEMATGRLEDFRPEGFGHSSREFPRAGPGGAPYEAPSPLNGFNAEWGDVQLDRTPQLREPGGRLQVPQRVELHLRLLNTGPVLWAAGRSGDLGTVVVEATQPGGRTQRIELRRTVPMGESVEISLVPADPGLWTLRPLLLGVGPFGEPLHLQVEAGP